MWLGALHYRCHRQVKTKAFVVHLRDGNSAALSRDRHRGWVHRGVFVFNGNAVKKIRRMRTYDIIYTMCLVLEAF